MNEFLNGNSKTYSARVYGQQSIFNTIDEEPVEEKEYSEEELLKYEKEALGIYITGHPLTKYDMQLKKLGTNRSSDLEDIPDGKEIRLGGILRNIKKVQTKSKTGIMAYGTLEDPEGNTDVIVFPELYRKHLSLLQKDSLLIVKGTIDKTEKGIKVIATDISHLDEHANKREHKAEICLRYPLPERINLQELRSVVLSNGEGEYPLYLRIFLKDAETLIATDMKISPDKNTINKIEKIAGKGAFIVQ